MNLINDGKFLCILEVERENQFYGLQLRLAVTGGFNAILTYIYLDISFLNIQCLYTYFKTYLHRFEMCSIPRVERLRHSKAFSTVWMCKTGDVLMRN